MQALRRAMKVPDKVRRLLRSLLPLFVMWLLLFALWRESKPGPTRAVSYTELLAAVRDGKVDQAELRADEITARLRPSVRS